MFSTPGQSTGPASPRRDGPTRSNTISVSEEYGGAQGANPDGCPYARSHPMPPGGEERTWRRRNDKANSMLRTFLSLKITLLAALCVLAQGGRPALAQSGGATLISIQGATSVRRSGT